MGVLNHLLGYNDGRSEPNTTHTSTYIMKGIDVLFHLVILFWGDDLSTRTADAQRAAYRRIRGFISPKPPFSTSCKTSCCTRKVLRVVLPRSTAVRGGG